MKKGLLIIIYLIFSLKAISQDKRTFFYASLFDEVSTIPNAHIVNLNTKQGTFSNDNGEFRILAKHNDSLQISFVGYETKIVKITSTHFGLQENKIELKKVPIELDEVEVKKHDLLGYIDTDTKHIKAEKEINAETLNLPFAGSRILTPAERRLYTSTGGGNILSVDRIINLISGRIKKLKKDKAIEGLERRIQNIHSNYHIFIQYELKILEKDIFRFIYFTESSSNFNPSMIKNEVVMISFLREKSKEFKKLNSEDYK